MRPADVTVLILHPHADPGAGPLSSAVADARAMLAEHHRSAFLAAGASDARVVSEAPDGTTFGARLRRLVREDVGEGGVVVLGSGAIPLASARDRRAFVEAAASRTPGALANDRYSADVVAIACARTTLADLPNLATDNALPRWLEEGARIPVADRRDRWRLGVDIDGPLDIALLGAAPVARSAVVRAIVARLAPADRARVDEQLTAIRAVAADPRRELLVAGRLSADGLRFLERSTASRTRALVEERGLRTAPGTGQRPPASSLGLLLERDGPAAFGRHLVRLGDAAIVDTRVLLAHRFGADDASWPTPEDRFASDLGLHERIVDPWLRDLTVAAASAPIPVLLGGHTTVGPGLRLVLGRG